ncbi:MAG TPA: LuxR C-terminal-related transcriptional regulator, partial [Candidatus Limnocylindrales bacterium]|nr:LuxR C-terminal-related transcriptional regulator [Candidatus Limnocylindrales bacterium]
LAADPRCPGDQFALALRHVGLEPGALEPAVAAGLVDGGPGGPVFRHPMVRATVYAAASESLRREIHGILAVIAGPGATEARAWHLAAAASGDDDVAAEALEAAASSASRRGAHESAFAALERAASMTSDPATRVRRLVAGAEACRLAGLGESGLRLLDQALVDASGPVARADIQLLRARILFGMGSMDEVRALLVREADVIEAVAPDRAATMLTEASWACTAAADVALALRASKRGHAIARRVGGPVELAASLAWGESLVLAGRMGEARVVLRGCLVALEHHVATIAPPFSPTSAMTFLVAEEYEVAGSMMHGQVAAARELGAPALLAYVLASRSDYRFRVGDWAAAHADAAEALRLADERGWPSIRPFILIAMARVEAGLGRPDSLGHADAGERLVGRHGSRSLIIVAQSARALYHLGAGHADEAIAELEQTVVLWESSGCRNPNVVQWMPDLVEAYVHAGRRADAERALALLQQGADRTGGRWANAAAARCRGLLAAGDGEDAFEQALAIHAAYPGPFDAARTHLAFGERLRRAGHRVRSRPHLRAALETFERLGAGAWADRARGEIGGSVEHVVRGRAPIDRLSPQELQVAFQVAAGATNAEAGAALFVSRKTVEFHLRNVYRKLDIRSRTDLARVMAERGPHG